MTSRSRACHEPMARVRYSTMSLACVVVMEIDPVGSPTPRLATTHNKVRYLVECDKFAFQNGSPLCAGAHVCTFLRDWLPDKRFDNRGGDINPGRLTYQ